jgi:sugar lactone lactonase YvrE
MTRTFDGAEVAVPVPARLGEGPVWDDRDSTLVFVDIHNHHVHRWSPADGSVSTFTAPGPVGFAVLREDGGLLMGVRDSFVRCTPAGDLESTIRLDEIDTSTTRFNDGKVDPWGNVVAGTMDLQMSAPSSKLYRLSPEGAVTTLLTDVVVSNGLGWTADRRTMFYVDSGPRTVDAFEVDPADGTLGARRRVVQLDFVVDGGPDGLCVDTDGCAWVATWAGSAVRRYTPDGELDSIVPLPVKNITSCAFGGPRLDHLYITTSRNALTDDELRAQPHAGHVFVLDLSATGITGVPNTRFG